MWLALRVRVLSRGIKALFSSLSLTLFVWAFGVIIVTFAAFAFVSIRSTSRQWNETVYRGAERFSELIQHSTHYSMLLNRKEEVQHVIRTVAETPGVEGVRIYDKTGLIISSAVESELGQRVDLHAEACVSCHMGPEPLQTVPEGDRVRTFTGPGGVRILGLINPIENEAGCARAGCHASPQEQSILGVLDVRMSMAEPDARLATARRQAVISAVLTALLAGLLSAGFIFFTVRRPVKRLISGTGRVASGDLTTEIDIGSRNEIGQLATSFNKMTADLREAQAELTAWSIKLERKLQEKTDELSQSQRQVAHMDKMASLGKLAATVAHELNNPLAGILTYAKLVERTCKESGVALPEQAELDRYLHLIQKEASRSGTIVRNLLTFARRSGSEFALHHLKAIMERSLMLIRHRVEISGIRLAAALPPDDVTLVCDGDQIQQALLALLINAVEAMPNGGTLRLAAECADDLVVIYIEDTGVGIPEEALTHIFEPFFSTKDDAHGAGLGLAVVYGIVQWHGGKIEVDSKLDRGTRFRVALPRQPAANREPEGGRVTEEMSLHAE